MAQILIFFEFPQTLPRCIFEIEIIEKACRELSSSEIAERLFIAVRTVETHRKRIMENTNSRNFLGSMLYAIRKGMVDIENL